MFDHAQLEKEVMFSRQRCRERGIKQDLIKPQIALDYHMLQVLLEEHSALISAFTHCIQEMENTITGKYLFLLADPEGVLLSWKTTTNLGVDSYHKCSKYSDHLTLGISFSEESSGTNAIALACKLKQPVFLLPRHHYCHFFQEWSCYAIPLFIQKQVVGYLDVSTIDRPLAGEMMAVIFIGR